MKSLRTLGILTLLLLLNCGKSTETTIVTDNTDLLPGQRDTTQTPNTILPAGQAGSEFIQVRIGEIDAIESLDPLFAHSNSELRTIHLIYDGLTRLDDLGNVVPAIAKRWEATRDSLRFTFTLDRNVYYHNSSVFSNGLGRRVLARDVERAFLRMGSVEVPDYAADLFSGIRGFNAYHTEQTYVKNPAKRVISQIEGISVRNDSTVVIFLEEKDPDFLRKLAHPWASVYATESLNNRGPISRPVGSGPFYYVRTQAADLILASNNNYPFAENLPDRLDIRSGLREADLFQSFARGELDLLNEIGPETMNTVMNPDGSLSISYRGDYQIYDPELMSTFTLYYNPSSERPDVARYLTSLDPDSLISNNLLGSVSPFGDFSQDTTGIIGGQIQVSHTTSPFQTYLLNQIAVKLSSSASFSMNGSYAVTREVALSMNMFENAEPLLVWHVPLIAIAKDGFSGIQISVTPWNISFSKVKPGTGDN